MALAKQLQNGQTCPAAAYYAGLASPEESADFFGFYNTIGKLATVVGALLVAGAPSMTGSTPTAVIAQPYHCRFSTAARR